MDHERSPYMSFLLRLWLEDGGELKCTDRFLGEWRASLEDPHTQAMQVFANLEALFDYLLQEAARRASGEDVRHQQEIDDANDSAHIPGA